MHPSLQQRVDGVAALRARTSIATAAFYAMIGQELPVQKIRYQVVTKGKAYHIIELATRKVKGFRWTWKEAVNFAQQLEARADGIKVSLSGDRK
jgi:Gpi18-like mannosyltransferase